MIFGISRLCLVRIVIGIKKANISQYFLLKFIFAEKKAEIKIDTILKNTS